MFIALRRKDSRKENTQAGALLINIHAIYGQQLNAVIYPLPPAWVKNRLCVKWRGETLLWFGGAGIKKNKRGRGKLLQVPQEGHEILPLQEHHHTGQFGANSKWLSAPNPRISKRRVS